MTWFQSQFDKLLMTFLIVAFCTLAIFSSGAIQSFALTSAGGCMGCILTLVTARRNSAGDLPPAK